MDTITTYDLLIPPPQDNKRASKDLYDRLEPFVAWLIETQREWHNPDLTAYMECLRTDGYAPATIKAHLATIRGRYRDLLRTGALHGAAFQLASDEMEAVAKLEFANNLVREAMTLLYAPTAQVKVPAMQHQYIYLTAEQVNQLLSLPDAQTPKGLRDLALIGLMIGTGIREAELIALQVSDLRHESVGQRALRVPTLGKSPARLVPYHHMEWALQLVEIWLEHTGIQEGPVFRPFYHHRSGHILPKQRFLTQRAVRDILNSYPIADENILIVVKPLDLRHSYARQLAETGISVEQIQHNLGQLSPQTTLDHIGQVDAPQKPLGRYQFDLTMLTKDKKS